MYLLRSLTFPPVSHCIRAGLVRRGHNFKSTWASSPTSRFHGEGEFQNISSSTVIGFVSMSTRHYTKGTRTSELPPEGSTKSETLARKKDPDLIRRLAGFANEKLEDFLLFLETVDARKVNRRSIEVSLKTLIHLLENKRYLEMEIQSTFNSVGMQKFCRALKKNSHLLDVNMLMMSLNLFRILEVPGSNSTLQCILKLLLKETEGMESDKINDLSGLLEKLSQQSSSPIVETLKQNLPTAFEMDLLQRLQQDHDVKTLRQILELAVEKKCSNRVIAKIILKLNAKHEDARLKDALSIIWRFVVLRADVEGMDDLLKSMFEIVTKHIQGVDMKELRELILRCSSECLHGRLGFYHPAFLDATIDRILQTGNARMILSSVEILWTMRHLNVDLLEASAELLISNPALILNNDTLFYSILKTYADLNYKPEQWDELKSFFLSHPAAAEVNNISKKDLMLINHFLILGELPIELLDSYNSIDSLHLDSSFVERSMVFNAISQLFPEHSASKPDFSTVEIWSDRMRMQSKNFDYPLKESLLAALGGRDYLITGLVHNGMCIDHCIVLNRNGDPVRQTSIEWTRVEEIKRILRIPDSVRLEPKNSMQYTVRVRPLEYWIKDKSLLTTGIACYTDGSKSGKYSGIGIHIESRDTNDCRTIYKQSLPLGKNVTAFQCEISAILCATEYFLHSRYVGRDIHFYCDCVTALEALKSAATTSSLVLECYKKLNQLGNDNLVELHCIPSHRGFEGNEKADRLAKARAGSTTTLDMIERPENSFLILLKVFRPNAYLWNTKRLRGYYALEQEILKSYGHLISVNFSDWKKLGEFERIPFLMEKISSIVT